MASQLVREGGTDLISITRLYCGAVTPSDALRYGRDGSRMPSHLLRFAEDKKPIVVWNMTGRCNLSCIHCYYNASTAGNNNELSTPEGKAMLDDLGEFGVPVVLFSGGEPLMRKDLIELAMYAAEKGLRTVLSTNGTLLTKETVKAIKKAGLSYVGVSLDGMEGTNDRFRGSEGAFGRAVQGIRNCVEAGQRVGLRMTLTRHNYADLRSIFSLIERENIDRACFYHLVYTGRGSGLLEDDLGHGETRAALDLICGKAREYDSRGVDKEILTVDNHADGAYVYLKLRSEGAKWAGDALQLMRWNGGNNSGIGIGAVDSAGNVHADQFWQEHSFGNVRERKFGDIWTDTGDELMRGLKDRKRLLKGRCAECGFLDICNGNFRVRALAVHGDVWAQDPACYLTDQETRGAA